MFTVHASAKTMSLFVELMAGSSLRGELTARSAIQESDPTSNCIAAHKIYRR